VHLPEVLTSLPVLGPLLFQENPNTLARLGQSQSVSFPAKTLPPITKVPVFQPKSPAVAKSWARFNTFTEAVSPAPASTPLKEPAPYSSDSFIHRQAEYRQRPISPNDSSSPSGFTPLIRSPEAVTPKVTFADPIESAPAVITGAVLKPAKFGGPLSLPSQTAYIPYIPHSPEERRLSQGSAGSAEADSTLTADDDWHMRTILEVPTPNLEASNFHTCRSPSDFAAGLDGLSLTEKDKEALDSDPMATSGAATGGPEAANDAGAGDIDSNLPTGPPVVHNEGEDDPDQYGGGGGGNNGDDDPSDHDDDEDGRHDPPPLSDSDRDYITDLILQATLLATDRKTTPDSLKEWFSGVHREDAMTHYQEILECLHPREEGLTFSIVPQALVIECRNAAFREAEQAIYPQERCHLANDAGKLKYHYHGFFKEAMRRRNTPGSGGSPFIGQPSGPRRSEILGAGGDFIPSVHIPRPTPRPPGLASRSRGRLTRRPGSGRQSGAPRQLLGAMEASKLQEDHDADMHAMADLTDKQNDAMVAMANHMNVLKREMSRKDIELASLRSGNTPVPQTSLKSRIYPATAIDPQTPIGQQQQRPHRHGQSFAEMRKSGYLPGAHSTVNAGVQGRPISTAAPVVPQPGTTGPDPVQLQDKDVQYLGDYLQQTLHNAATTQEGVDKASVAIIDLIRKNKQTAATISSATFTQPPPVVPPIIPDVVNHTYYPAGPAAHYSDLTRKMGASAGSSDDMQQATATAVKLLHMLDGEKQEDTYCDNFIPSPPLGDRDLTPRVKKDFGSQFQTQYPTKWEDNLIPLLKAARTTIIREQLNLAGALELLRGYLPLPGSALWKSATKLDAPFFTFWTHLQLQCTPESSPDKIDQQLHILKTSRPENVLKVMYNILDLHLAKHPTQSQDALIQMTVVPAEEDIKVLLKRWFPHLATDIIARAKRKQRMYHHLISLGQNPPPEDTWSPCYDLIEFAIKGLGNQPPLGNLHPKAQPPRGNPPRHVHEVEAESAPLPDLLQDLPEEFDNKENVPPTMDNVECEELYNQAPMRIAQNNDRRRDYAPPNYPVARAQEYRPRPQQQQLQQQPQQHFQQQSPQNQQQPGQAMIKFHNRLNEMNNQMDKMKLLLQGQRGNAELDQNITKNLVERPPYQSAKFNSLPKEGNRIVPGYEVDQSPKDSQGKPVQNIPYCYLCNRLGHVDESCWTFPDSKGRHERQCGICAGYHLDECRPWVMSDPNQLKSN
jgi:hypothetical protein